MVEGTTRDIGSKGAFFFFLILGLMRMPPVEGFVRALVYKLCTLVLYTG
jgi:hypothetical protein